MSKGDHQRGNREAKKPKKEKPKAPATANFAKSDQTPKIGDKKKK